VRKPVVLAWGALLLVMVGITMAIRLGNSSSGVPPVASPTATASRPSPSPIATPTPAATPTPTPRPTATYVPPPPPPRFSISGRGFSDSRTFQLSNLTYTVSYSLGNAGPYFAYLRSTDGSYDNGDFINDNGPTSGTYYLHLSQLTDAYYVAMSTNPGCSWAMTFTPTGS
jgi:hypothetical protein